MHIDLRSEQRERLFTVDIDLDNLPAMVRSPEGDGTSVMLEWDRAIDDEHHLRRCPACSCPDLYVKKKFPQITSFALILLAALVAMVLFGFGQLMWAIITLVILLGLDVAIYFLDRKMLVCYYCKSTFSGMPIARKHPRWDNTLGEKYQRLQAQHADSQPKRDTKKELSA